MDPESYYSAHPPRTDSDVPATLVMDQAEFSWQLAEESFRLTDLSVNIPKGKFVGVIGRVGSGKSSFLQAITGDLLKRNGHIFVHNWQQGPNFNKIFRWILN